MNYLNPIVLFKMLTRYFSIVKGILLLVFATATVEGVINDIFFSSYDYSTSMR